MGVAVPESGQDCQSVMQGPFYREQLTIPANSPYDFNFGYSGIPGWESYGAALIIVEYRIPWLFKYTGAQAVFVPQIKQDGALGWISGTLRDFPACTPISEVPYPGLN